MGWGLKRIYPASASLGLYEEVLVQETGLFRRTTWLSKLAAASCNGGFVPVSFESEELALEAAVAWALTTAGPPPVPELL